MANGNFSWNLQGYSQAQLYDHLKSVIERACQRFRSLNEEACARNGCSLGEFKFEDADGRVNLLGVRGFEKDDMEPCVSTNNAWDDTLFAVYKEGGAKRVESYYLNTEQNNVDKAANPQGGLSFLVPGMHRYRLGHHGDRRALEPDTLVPTWWDKDQNYRDDDGAGGSPQGLQWLQTINIHYGGNGSTPVGWSAGCQTIKNEASYEAFLECVESDPSIKGSIDNEFAPQPDRDGTRSVLYTLVEGTYLEPGQAGIAPPEIVTPEAPTPEAPTWERPAPEPVTEAPATPSSSRPLLQRGSSGDDVELLQKRLNRLGYSSGQVDGIFGSQTEAAVRALQAATGLSVDGIVGPRTWEEVMRKRAVARKPTPSRRRASSRKQDAPRKKGPARKRGRRR